MSAGGGAPRGLDVVCVGFAEWDTELWTNQHHLMARLAAGNRVLFVESLGLRKPQLGGRDLKRIARRLVNGLQPPREVASPFGGTVLVLSPLVLPLHGNPVARALNARILPALVRRAAARAGMRAPVLWAYVPQAEVLVDALAPRRTIYHCVDDIAAQDGIDASGFRAAEARFAGAADLVLASAPRLAERMRTLNDTVVFAPNVADVERFAGALEPGPVDPALDALPRPRLVFTGAIAAKKLDLELLAGVARARPGWTLALVGPVGLGDPGTDVGALRALPNVHLLGARPYADLPAVLRGADVALIPYRSSQLTGSIFPMKVYEYLAAGLPVISTPLPALEGVEGVTVADGVRATVAAVSSALEDAAGPDARRARSALAAGHSWDTRLDEIGAALAALDPVSETAQGTFCDAETDADADARRGAALLFDRELAAGRVASADLERPEVLRAVRGRRDGPRPVRLAQQVAVKLGRLDPLERSLAPMLAARRAVLGGDAAAAPARVLVRVDEFPHYQAWDKPDRYGTVVFERFHAIMASAGVPYLVAVTPRVPRDGLDPREAAWREHDAGERAMLDRLRADGVAFGVHGLDHRTRHARPREHSELTGLDAAALSARLDAAQAVLAERGLPADVFVAPYNRFDAGQWPVLGRRCSVVTGGPESIGHLGVQPTPVWRGDAVYLPSYAPLYGRAGEVLEALDRVRDSGLWTPVVLHWGWEADDGWADLERLAAALGGSGGLARPWPEFLAAAEATCAR